MRIYGTRSGRRARTAAMSAVTLATLVAVVAPTEVGAVEAPPPSFQAFCANVPAGAGGFEDVAGNTHERAIDCLASADVVQGTGGLAFQPNAELTRGTMASWVAATIDLAGDLEQVALPALTSTPSDQFDDDDNSPHEFAINRLAAAGIVRGRGPGEFGPDELVTRGQMATFVNNMQSFLSSGLPFSSAEDFFDDDDGLQPHEPNINGIASVGVAQGTGGRNFNPVGTNTRGQISSFLVRYLGLLHVNGVIDELPPSSAGNGTIRFQPTSTARVFAVSEPSAADDRTFIADALVARDYFITLYQADLITEDPGPDFRFTEVGNLGVAASGSEGGPAPGNNGARIVVVNGEPVTPTGFVGPIRPIGGRITVTVDAVSFGRIRPVIHANEPGGFQALEIDDAGRPTESFGVAGVLETIPPHAGSGILGADAAILFVDEGDNLIVARGATEAHYRYDDGDELFVAPSATRVTTAQFEDRLSAGDRLDGTSNYSPMAGNASTLVLENAHPPPPAPRVESVGETTAVITADGVLPGASVKVYLGPAAASFTGTTVRATAAADENPSTPGFQVLLTGLSANTDFEYYVTQVLDGEESAPLFTTQQAGTHLRTTNEATPFVLAVRYAVARPTNTVHVDFSEAVTLADATRLSVACPGALAPVTAVTRTGTGATNVDGNTLAITLNGQMPTGGECTSTITAGLARDASNNLTGPDSRQVGNPAP